MTNQTMKKILSRVIICVLVFVLLFAFYSCKNDNGSNFSEVTGEQESNTEAETGILPELKITSTDIQEELVVLETTYGVIKYSSAFKDIVIIETFNGGKSAQLDVTADIDGQNTLVYTIYYNSNNGTPFGKIFVPKMNERIILSVVFEEIDNEWSLDWQTTFYAVQETFNDIVESMKENDNYFPIDS